MKETISNIKNKVGFSVIILTVGLALHGANDLRKNLHYGNNAMAAEIDSKEIKVKPLFTKDELNKMEKKS